MILNACLVIFARQRHARQVAGSEVDGGFYVAKNVLSKNPIHI